MKIRQAIRTISRYSLRPAVKAELLFATGVSQAKASALTPVVELEHKLLIFNYGRLALHVVPRTPR